MDILKIVVDKDRNLDVKNSPECKIIDLMSLVIAIVVEISRQSGKSINRVARDIKRLYKNNKAKINE